MIEPWTETDFPQDKEGGWRRPLTLFSLSLDLRAGNESVCARVEIDGVRATL